MEDFLNSTGCQVLAVLAVLAAVRYALGLARQQKEGQNLTSEEEITMLRRMKNGMLELLDGNGVVVGTRPATDQEIQEWGDFIGTRPATDQDIREWGDFIWKHLGGNGNMDTKTLVVGQDVYMESGIYGCKGKVVKVTPSGVEVQTDSMGLLRFDKDGNEPDVSRRERLGFGPSPESKFHTVLWHSAPEFQPWHIDDMPFAERTALFEKARQEYQDKMLPFVTWWKSATYEQRLEIVKKYYDILLPHVRSGMTPAEDMANITDISSNFYCQALASEQFCEWWKNEATT